MTFTLEQFNSAISPRRVTANADNERIIAKLDAAGATVDYVPAFMESDKYKNLTGHVLRAFASWYYAENGKAPKAPKAEPKAAAPKVSAPKVTAADEAAENLKNALSAFIGKQEAVLDEATVDRIVTEKVNAAIKAIKPATIEVKIAGDVRPMQGTTPHYMLADVLTDLVNGFNVYLYGPAGTGKTVLAKQAAEALGVPFYFTSKIDEVFQLTGFIDANSHYNETELYRCMQTGGVFLFDEIDASAPEATTAFNTLLANGFMDFPTGKVKKPENMYIIGAGNTNGLGGNSMYNTRQSMDESTRNRFVFEEIGYDPAIEKAIGESFEDKKLGADAVDVVRVIRKFSEKNGLEITASYRDITRLGKLAIAKGVSKAVVSCIKNKMCEDDYASMKQYAGMTRLAEKGNAFAAAICG